MNDTQKNDERKQVEAYLGLWMWTNLFDSSDVDYLIGESVYEVERANGSSDIRPGSRSANVLWNWDFYSVAGSTVSVVPRSSFLLPVEDNSVGIAAVGETALQLSFTLSKSIDIAAASDAEVDFYCDTSRPEVLESFHTLLQARWPDILSDYKRCSWPRPGLRPIWNASSGIPRLTAADLLDHVKHPYSNRFFRIPVEPVWNALRNGNKVTIDVDAGSSNVRDSLIRDLGDSIKLNHCLFWNRSVARSPTPGAKSKQVVVETYVAGTRPVVLEAIDVETSCAFGDVRWSFDMDPARQFKLVEHDDDCLKFSLRFQNGEFSRDLRVAFLASHSALAFDDEVSSAVIRRRGRAAFRIKERFRSVFASDPASAERIALAWSVNGNEEFPHVQLTSRRRIARFIVLNLPKPLRDKVKFDDDIPTYGIQFESILAIDSDGTGDAYPATVVEIPVRGAVNQAALGPYVEWLSRLVSEHSTGPSVLLRLKEVRD